MKILVHNTRQEYLFSCQIPADQRPDRITDDQNKQSAELDWQGAIGDDGCLKGCPLCHSRELFKRKDFPQALGMGLVVLGGVGSVICFAMNQLLLSIGILGALVLIDLPIYLLTPQCIVCYRCRSEFKDTPIGPAVGEWDLAIGEKYRIID